MSTDGKGIYSVQQYILSVFSVLNTVEKYRSKYKQIQPLYDFVSFQKEDQVAETASEILYRSMLPNLPQYMVSLRSETRFIFIFLSYCISLSILLCRILCRILIAFLILILFMILIFKNNYNCVHN